MFSSISQSFRVSGCKKNANLFIEDIERNLESMNVVIPPKGDINIKDSNDTRVIFETDFGADG
ncbi:MAG: hypothetical protein SFT91_02610, partial [Rickettsiaceae bacterium]|nr:hypothetical protein [Rickettsiaceae bacterium]